MRKIITVAVTLALSSCVPIAPAFPQRGLASWYHEGTRTASGERFRPNGFTVAHRTLPFGTRVHVCRGSRCVNARVNDRGPAAWTGRSIDLSRGVASILGIIRAGVALVTFNVIR